MVLSEQIRSADFLVRTALADPTWIQGLKHDPETTLKSLAKEATASLPTPAVAPPTSKVNDAIWLIVVAAFALVMVGSAFVLGTSIDTEIKTNTSYVTKGETILTVFTTVVAFLAGLLSPSPVRR